MVDRDQRRFWAEERERRGLLPGGGQFVDRGLMKQLDEPRVLVTALPADPLRAAVDVPDDALFADILPRSFRGQTAKVVGALSYQGRTAESVARYARFGQEDARWRAFVAVRCDGGVDVGMGSGACWTHPSESALAGRVSFRLFVLVRAVRVAIATQARLCRHVVDQGPFELIVAIHMLEGAILNAFASGWERPEYAFEVSTALQAHPILREEVESWPADSEDQHDLLLKVAGRSCSAFDVAEPRFLPWLGQGVGQLSEDYA